MKELLRKAKKMQGVELYDYQEKFVERFIGAIKSGKPIEEFSRNSVLFIERMYSSRFKS